MSHTPGPWTPMNEGIYKLVYGPNGERVCKVMDNKDDQPLIEAAPELLDCLEELADLVEAHLEGEYEIDSFTTQPARTAIEEAKQERR